MRIPIAVPLLLAPMLLAACTVERDPRNGQTTIGVDDSGIANTADRIGDAVENGAAEVQEGGRALRNEVRGLDVDVDVRRDEPGNSTRNSN